MAFAITSTARDFIVSGSPLNGLPGKQILVYRLDDVEHRCLSTIGQNALVLTEPAIFPEGPGCLASHSCSPANRAPIVSVQEESNPQLSNEFKVFRWAAAEIQPN